jgi:hypothetical protein
VQGKGHNDIGDTRAEELEYMRRIRAFLESIGGSCLAARREMGAFAHDSNTCVESWNRRPMSHDAVQIAAARVFDS